MSTVEHWCEQWDKLRGRELYDFYYKEEEGGWEETMDNCGTVFCFYHNDNETLEKTMKKMKIVFCWLKLIDILSVKIIILCYFKVIIINSWIILNARIQVSEDSKDSSVFGVHPSSKFVSILSRRSHLLTKSLASSSIPSSDVSGVSHPSTTVKGPRKKQKWRRAWSTRTVTDLN